MPFIERDQAGKIVGLFNRAQADMPEEFLPDTDAAVIAFRTPTVSPLDQLEALITQGQEAMTSDPLPLDIQKQIFDLEVFIRNYFQRGATALIQQSINGFTIPDDRTDVTTDQRNLVTTLKNQMLEVFNV